MFNHRHGPRALLTRNFFGVTFLLLIIAGSYDALIQPSSTDVNSTEFVKGKSEFCSNFHLESERGSCENFYENYSNYENLFENYFRY